MRGVGGIPARSTVCATLSPSGTQDDTARIQGSINTCPVGQVVQLTAGTFLINSGHYLVINKGITLRGAGPGKTTLAKTNGAKPFQSAVRRKPSPLIVVGPSLFSTTGHSNDVVRSTNLTADAAKGTYSVNVENAAGFSPGQIVLLDEASGADWRPDPQGRGQIWAAPRLACGLAKAQTGSPYVDDFAADAFPTTPGTAGSWFSRLDRPTSEVKQIAADLRRRTVTFTTPDSHPYRQRHAAQLSRYRRRHVKNAGVEDLTLTGGDAGNLRFNWAALSWAKNVESTVWHGEGVAIHAAFRIELREFYIHDGAWSQPGGGGYAISLSAGTAETLIENGIAVRANKVIVARSAGAGSVVGYNYMDMSYINTNGAWVETGINASHMVGSHHVLFEGNYGHNADSDQTHGNSIYHTFFRNQFRGVRAPFDNQAGGRIDDATAASQRAAALRRPDGLFLLDVVRRQRARRRGPDGWLGLRIQLCSGKRTIWMLGWDAVKPYRTDAQVAATALRHGNFDYLTNTVQWDPEIGRHALPNSLTWIRSPRSSRPERLHLAVGRSGRTDQAPHASGEGALRRRHAVYAALNGCDSNRRHRASA